MHTDLIKSLTSLARHLSAGNEPGLLATIEAVGLQRLLTLDTFVLALCLEGVPLVAFLASVGIDHTTDVERFERLLRVCETALQHQTPPREKTGPSTALSHQIIRAWDTNRDPQTVLASIERSLLYSMGTADQILRASIDDMLLNRWPRALEGLQLIRKRLNRDTPRVVFAHSAVCLHRLGHYAEAELVAQEGLGLQRNFIALKSRVLSESDLIASWGASSSPLLSILCTTFNHRRYIEKTIQGFLSQRTTFPFEILIHDDASADGTQELIDVWQKRYPRIIFTILQTENQLSRGVRPFELLLARARGNYVATCEGDDYWIEPSKLQRQVDFLQSHSDFSCAAHNHYLYDEDCLTVRPWLNSRTERVLSQRELLNLTRLLWLPTLVFRKTFSEMPPERSFSPYGDSFLTSYLGTFGKCIYSESFFGAVRRRNQYSSWTPLSEPEKEFRRVKAWIALIRLHENSGNEQAVLDLMRRVSASPLPRNHKTLLMRQSAALSHNACCLGIA